MIRRLGLLACLAALGVLGCNADDGVSVSDSEKNKQEFSQENYEAAMKAAGREKELEEEKARNATSQQAGQG